MAIWIGVARSNYFRVKDVDAFKKEMEGFPGVRVEHKKEGEAPHFALFGDEGYWPTHRDISDPENDTYGDEEVEFDAVNSKGEQLDVSIDSIYEMAREKWGVRPTAAAY